MTKGIMVLIILIIFGMEGLHSQSSPVPFMTRFTPKPAIVTDYAYKDTIPSNCGLVRLPNGKIAFMIRENERMVPFYIRAIETGYWNTRYESDTNYDKIFADMREMGANTAYVMIHWEEIEISDNCFDYTFADHIVEAAARQQLKVNWILFLHAQKNGVPSGGAENMWTFHLDDRDSCNYTMQWPMKNGEVYKNVKTLLRKGGIRPLHMYGHPEIFYRIRRMLYNLAVHYRESKTVIGVQLGNEEGFSFLDESDYNPVTRKLYEEWKLKNNKTSYPQFKKEAMNWWWKQFTTSYHEGDPYKILSFNLDAAQAEAGDPERVAMTGTGAATYSDGNLDVIGTMLYKQWGYKALQGLDAFYNEGRYNYELPILIPSEIGIGRFNSSKDFRGFVLHSLKRGAQGFGVYCYGEVKKGLPDSSNARQELINMFAAIKANEDVIYSGLPGVGYMQCCTMDSLFHISHLNVNGERTLALLYHQDSFNEGKRRASRELPLVFKARQDGDYIVTIYKNGLFSYSRQISVLRKEELSLVLSDITSEDVIFIDIHK